MKFIQGIVLLAAGLAALVVNVIFAVLLIPFQILALLAKRDII